MSKKRYSVEDALAWKRWIRVNSDDKNHKERKNLIKSRIREIKDRRTAVELSLRILEAHILYSLSADLVMKFFNEIANHENVNWTIDELYAAVIRRQDRTYLFMPKLKHGRVKAEFN